MTERDAFEPDGFGCGSGPHLHAPDEAAALLQIPEATLRRKAGNRLYPSTKVGRHLRFSDDDLRQIIALHKRSLAPPKRSRARSR
jgi:excisionase family DNA binding protein